MTRYIYILLVIVFTAACTNVRTQSLQALEDREQQFLEAECKLNPLFKGEPEFAELTETQFCTGEISITRFLKLSDTEAIVDYEITFRARHDQISQWLDAYSDLEARRIPSVKQQRIKALIDQVSSEDRDWIYRQHIVTMILTENGWVIDKIIR